MISICVVLSSLSFRRKCFAIKEYYSFASAYERRVFHRFVDRALNSVLARSEEAETEEADNENRRKCWLIALATCVRQFAGKIILKNESVWKYQACIWTHF